MHFQRREALTNVFVVEPLASAHMINGPNGLSPKFKNILDYHYQQEVPP